MFAGRACLAKNPFNECSKGSAVRCYFPGAKIAGGKLCAAFDAVEAHRNSLAGAWPGDSPIKMVQSIQDWLTGTGSGLIIFIYRYEIDSN